MYQSINGYTAHLIINFLRTKRFSKSLKSANDSSKSWIQIYLKEKNA
jgi:hypothetical protein